MTQTTGMVTVGGVAYAVNCVKPRNEPLQHVHVIRTVIPGMGPL